ncbi:type II secretion system F family protein [Pseudoduganella sp. FT25W]|jgi:tight adherence protein C|uniref:Type II secretion system F family protein n=1 Tax=Duganella alba TaxID=2666081 RepID=A0A6L5QNI4_9BURK|nr:type II secretion system F family protein [Duganella alba]MRX11414.1 type II secretion system F family protein [Duganella alba]MRX19597.1 type II secretion system F family protein [Duganella alba]
MGNLLLQHRAAVIVVVALLCGVSATLLAWLCSRALSAVPQEDRIYKDDPPLGFRLAWWPIRWVSYFIEPWISVRQHAALLATLRQAGLDYTLSPAQLVAAKLIAGLTVMLLCWWGLGSFDTALPGERGFSLAVYLELGLAGALLGFFYPRIWLRDLLKTRRSELLKTLPFYLDIITLCVEAGLNLQGALNQAVAKGPKGVLRSEIQRVLRDIRAGKARADALRGMAERLNEPNVTHFVTAVIQAERMGMNLGPVLRAQADQRRSERFLRAEKLAMEAPVKMLFPLIAFIFPCTFIVLFFPIAMKFMHPGT